MTQGHLSIDCGLREQIAMLHNWEWPRSNGRVQLMFPPSLFGMDTTARRKQHVQEIYSGTKIQLGYLQVPRRTCRMSLPKSQGTIPRQGKKLQATTSKPQETWSMINTKKGTGTKTCWKAIAAFTSSTKITILKTRDKRGASKASRIKHEDPQFLPTGLLIHLVLLILSLAKILLRAPKAT